MKHIRTLIGCCMILLLASCSSAGKYYEAGITNLNIKNYVVAESNFKNAVEEGYTKDNVNVIYTIVSEYNNAKECYDGGQYDDAASYIEKIPNTYSDYVIAADIDVLKEQLKKIEDVASSIAKAQNLFDAGEYDDANAIILMIDTQYATDKQSEEISNIKRRIHLKKKNKDYEVLTRINTLVDSYVHGLCEAVNTGDFRPLTGCLYEGSNIYNTQKSYVASMAKKYVNDFAVNSVEWETETTCVISTSETYDIYDGIKSRTQTFRYTYDVIETTDKQLFLTDIRKSY